MWSRVVRGRVVSFPRRHADRNLREGQAGSSQTGVMFTRPPDIPDSTIVDVLSEVWGIDVFGVDYAPVGFGSHHWRTRGGSTDWFVTVDDLDAKRRDQSEAPDETRKRLIAALAAAKDLAARGLGFVVAPRLTVHGSVAYALTARYVVAVYPAVPGHTFDYGSYDSRADRFEVLNLLVELHATPRDWVPSAWADDLAISNRDDLETALGSLETPWPSGPFGDMTRQLLHQHAAAVTAALPAYDNQAALVLARPERTVVTHGEPHRANTIVAEQGRLLIDWDTALIAPPERDLWELITEDPAIAQEYTKRTGTPILNEVVDLYRMSWDLNEIAIYVSQFRQEHVLCEDTEESWTNLQRFLDPDRW